MSYQVLARKWRPKNFQTLVGQEHVVKALTHALEQKRLHHAYLFTGTRGVGKTTLSRILAKALNCVGPDGDGDITATPCGVCRPCIEIDAGRFVDYIEMDAASNRGVEEMATLLEQAVYAPSNARFKVYMIDEVHMLTNHAFNAMLKTLEEPPEYVKFILATTDPQKIPATVLSRCLQFNLKQMPPFQIVGHLEQVLEKEGIGSEKEALRLLAHAAAGSMRDALSLTDQAIAYSGGTVTEAAVRAMLGALDQSYLFRILNALLDADGVGVLAVADEIAARSLSFSGALQDLASLLHRIAVVQTVPGAAGDDWTHRAEIEAFAARMTAEEVQLYYQIATLGRSELGLAPDEFSGFTMTLLRLLAFRPGPDPKAVERGPADARPSSRDASAGTAPISKAPVSTVPISNAPMARAVTIQSVDMAPTAAATDRGTPPVAGPAGAPATGIAAVRAALAAAQRSPGERKARAMAPSTVASATPSHLQPATRVLPEPALPTSGAEVAPVAAATSAEPDRESSPRFDGDWLALLRTLKVTGIALQLARNAELVRYDGKTFSLRVGAKSFLDAGAASKLEMALTTHFRVPQAVAVEVGAIAGSTAAALDQQAQDAKMTDAVAAIDQDPFVQSLVREFGATIVPGSIRPVA